MVKNILVKNTLFALALLSLSGCMGMPKDVTPVKEFSLERYLGKWYEIARLDHSFEQGLDNVTALYSLGKDGKILVKNRGYSTTQRQWKEVEGKAYLARSQNDGYLKVSFFGPFYSSYVIFDLDRESYQYAFVSGYNNSYLWLLARQPAIEEEIVEKFIEKAKRYGFNTNNLIFVNHDAR